MSTVRLAVSVGDNVLSIELGHGEPVEHLQALLEAETGVPVASQRLVHNGRDLAPSTTLAAAGVVDGDLVVLIQAQTPAAGQQPPPPAGSPLDVRPDGSAVDPRALQAHLRADRALLSRLRESGGDKLADAILGSDPEALQRALREQHAANLQRDQEMRRTIDQLNADPLDFEAQKKIEELIQQENIAENLEQAMENTPEAFGQVVMLYVDMSINGVPVKAFVDSGAQMSIMNVNFAERCSLMRLVDKRWAGVAKGVGTQKIIGRVHQAPIDVGGSHLSCAITVLEKEQDIDFIFGLDLLRRHQCSIDLKANCLHIGTTGTAVRFLSEGEIPRGPVGSEPAPGPADAGTGPQPSSSPATSTAATPAAASGSKDDASIAQLMGLGFEREAAQQALLAANGNVELAASMLFQAGGMDF